VISSVDELGSLELKFPLVIKSQVLIGGRGKAGGIQFADNIEQAKDHADKLLGSTIRDFTVNELLLENKLNIESEFYLAITIDRGRGTPVLITSASGGVDIEHVPEEQILKRSIYPYVGLSQHHFRAVIQQFGVEKTERAQVTKILEQSWQAFLNEDAGLVEINPLVRTTDGQWIAADAKMTIDDDALFRHPDYEDLPQELTPLEEKAKEQGIAFIQLDGNIGVIANGAGLTMATLDSLKARGGEGGVFLDLGGTDNPEKVQQAFRLMNEAKPSVIFLNIFGGITKCDTVARGVSDVISKEGISVPVVARIKGRNEEEARKILHEAGIVTKESLPEAAQEVVALSKAGGD